MTRKLVFWTAFNSFQSERTMRQVQPGDPHPVTTLEWTEKRIGYFRKFNLPSIFNGLFFAHRLDPKTMKFFDRAKRHPGHKSVAAYHPQELPEGNFCVLLHDKNTSSHPGMRHVSKTRADNKILQERFGL